MKKRKKRRAGKALFIILLLSLAVLLAVKDSADNLELTQYTVSPDNLPQSFEDYKIIQLSDFHGARLGNDIVSMVQSESPDIIVLTGDFITTAEDLPAVDELLGELVKVCDVYFISGNHDFGSGEISALSDILDKNGVIYLHNEYVTLEKNGEKIILAGVEDPNSWAQMKMPDELADEIRAEYPDSTVILLGHRNYWMTEYPALPVDLILCGHEHGGIIRLPGIGGLLSSERTLFPEYSGGMYENGEYTMIVSRGIGNSISIPRLFNRPEIVSIILN